MSDSTQLERKRCPKCSTVYEGKDLSTLHSCDQCGNGYLSVMAPKILKQDDPSNRLPRAGGQPGLITHTRDGF